MAATSIE
jgi:hypothetical protein